MAYNQFPTDQYFIVVTDDNPTEAGSLLLGEDIELGHVVCTLQKFGAHSGGETLQVHIYGNRDLSTPIASSDEVPMADIDSLTASNWAGKVRFDFDRQHLDSGNTYYFGVQVNNYTFNDGVYFWAYALDWPDDINTYALSTKRGLQAAILGYS